MTKANKLSCATFLVLAITGTNPLYAGETCDVNKLQKKLYKKYELPEMPSALEDCGMGGFLSFDFDFDIDDLGNLFCDFAEDLVGDFQQEFSVDFSLDKNGLNFDSPLYSVSTPSVKSLAKDFVYGSSGAPEGLLDMLGDKYGDVISGAKNKIYKKEPSDKSAYNAFKQSVASGGAYSKEAIAEASNKIHNAGSKPSNYDEANSAGLSNKQFNNVSNLTESQIDSMTPEQLNELLTTDSSNKNTDSTETNKKDTAPQKSPNNPESEANQQLIDLLFNP